MIMPNLPKGLHVFERGWLSANNILFIDGDETFLVDSGYCSHAAQTVSLVESVLKERPLNFLINTHLHSDHCGGNVALQKRYPNLKTAIPPGQAHHVAQWDPVALSYLPTGQQCPQFKFDQTILPGSQLRFGVTDWQVHAAAGHDPHSLVFFEPADRILISADALWEYGFGVVFPELEGDDAFSQVAATLDMIERLAPKTIIPGHGPVFIYTPDVLKRARQRLESFVKNPPKHARHAAKVLLKFKLLDIQRQSFSEFVNWAATTSYFIQIKEKFFPDLPLEFLIDQLCSELIIAGVARKDGSRIINM
jgi:glyoxylase-like metal-dependent hydrolase (beta-lactamase superfamily II)